MMTKQCSTVIPLCVSALYSIQVCNEMSGIVQQVVAL